MFVIISAQKNQPRDFYLLERIKDTFSLFTLKEKGWTHVTKMARTCTGKFQAS